MQHPGMALVDLKTHFSGLVPCHPQDGLRGSRAPQLQPQEVKQSPDICQQHADPNGPLRRQVTAGCGIASTAGCNIHTPGAPPRLLKCQVRDVADGSDDTGLQLGTLSMGSRTMRVMGLI